MQELVDLLHELLHVALHEVALVRRRHELLKEHLSLLDPEAPHLLLVRVPSNDSSSEQIEEKRART